jgi:hypothetical protein
MSSSDRDLQSKLDAMEAELNQNNASASQESTTERETIFSRIEINPSPQIRSWIDSGKELFNNLPKVGQAAIAIGAVWLSFSILGAILHIVSSIVSIAILGFILYIGYKLFTKNSSQQ